MSNHRRRYYRREESYGYGVPKITYPQLPTKVPHRHDTGSCSCSWQSSPAWEKRFCVKVGGMSWKRFVKAKMNLHETDKIFDWNDSAGLRAFNEAKQRFWAEFHGFPCKKGLPSAEAAADTYIDKHIDWNPRIDPNILSEMKSLSDDENEEEAEVATEIDWFSIPLDQIKPTGWVDDVCDYAPQLPKVVG